MSSEQIVCSDKRTCNQKKRDRKRLQKTMKTDPAVLPRVLDQGKRMNSSQSLNLFRSTIKQPFLEMFCQIEEDRLFVEGLKEDTKLLWDAGKVKGEYDVSKHPQFHVDACNVFDMTLASKVCAYQHGKVLSQQQLNYAASMFPPQVVSILPTLL